MTGQTIVAVLCAAAPSVADAHSFGVVYSLPVPIWMYLYGAAATVIVSFLVVGFFIGAPQSGLPESDANPPAARFSTIRSPLLIGLVQLAAICALLLAIVSGGLGTAHPYQNINMTLFWVVFVLGFTYAVAVLGDWYAVINPIRLLAYGLRRVFRGYGRGRWRYPRRRSYWPAVCLYMLFIAFELEGPSSPASLSGFLAGYLVLSLVGVGAWGFASWFKYCDFLAVFLRLIAVMAPVRLERGLKGGVRLSLRWPFAGLMSMRVADFSVLIFILFMLSATAFDGLRETILWKRLFWGDLFQLLEPWVGSNPFRAVPILRPWFTVFQLTALLLSPWLYLLCYGVAIAAVRKALGGARSLRDLAVAFAPSLLPIALVYHVSHYYSLLLTQGVKIAALASDPFGFGWNLFGTAYWYAAPIVPDPELIWNGQLALIVVGHIVGIVIAHLIALRECSDHCRAVISQLPMLVLMVLFTVFGLWVLSLPIQGG